MEKYDLWVSDGWMWFPGGYWRAVVVWKEAVYTGGLSEVQLLQQVHKSDRRKVFAVIKKLRVGEVVTLAKNEPNKKDDSGQYARFPRWSTLARVS